MRVYAYRLSSNSQKVFFCLHELGLRFELVEVPPARPRPQWYLEVNPLGLVPTLVDGDLVLPESNTIMRYLAAKAGRDDLYPSDPAERALVDRVLDAQLTSFRPASMHLERAGLGFRPGQGFFAEDVDLQRLAEAIEDQRPAIDGFLGLLGPEPWGALGRFTIADAAAAPFLWRLRHAPGVLDAYPRLASWTEAVVARPAFAPVRADAGL